MVRFLGHFSAVLLQEQKLGNLVCKSRRNWVNMTFMSVVTMTNVMQSKTGEIFDHHVAVLVTFHVPQALVKVQTCTPIVSNMYRSI